MRRADSDEIRALTLHPAAKPVHDLNADSGAIPYNQVASLGVIGDARAVPDVAARVIRKLCAREPSQRFDSARTAERALRAIGDDILTPIVSETGARRNLRRCP